MTTTVKTCFKCGKNLSLSQFYKHSEMADGHLNKCKECAKADVRDNRFLKYEYYQRFDRKRSKLPHRLAALKAYQKTPRGREVHNRATKWSRLLNPEKYAAHRAVARAIRTGELQRQPCEKCGARAHAHHEDYSKALEVRWLCAKHHAEEHQEESAA